jgi:MFS family permease
MKRFWANVAILSITLVLSADLTIINTALDKIQIEFGSSLSQIQWVINSFALSLAGFLIPMGRLADFWGRKKTLFLGIAIFILASIVAGAAPMIGLVIAARFFLGIAVAIMHPVTQVMMVGQFASHQKRQAVALWTMALGIGLVLGPFIGGFLVTYMSWRYVFFVPAIFIAVGAGLLQVFVKEKHTRVTKKIHPLDLALLIGALFFLIFPIVEGKYLGFGSKFVLFSFILSALLFVVLILFERRLKDPMIPLALLKKKVFMGCCLINFTISFFTWTLLFLIPFYLQKQLHQTAFDSGLFLLFFAGSVVLSSQIQSLIKKSLPEKNMFLIALVLFAVASALQFIMTFNLVALACTLILVGMATPTLQANSSSMVLSLVSEASFASSIAFLRMSQTIGGMIGVSINGAIIASHTLTTGYPIVFEVLLFSALFLMFVVIFLIPGKKSTTNVP